jgi:hypothetical protein
MGHLPREQFIELFADELCANPKSRERTAYRSRFGTLRVVWKLLGPFRDGASSHPALTIADMRLKA